MSDANFFDGLETDFKASSNPHKLIQQEKEAPRFPCTQCAGTGRYCGVRVHQEKTHCFACKGLGYFKKSASERFASREKAKARKLSAIETAKEIFNEANPGLIASASEIASWHTFAATMLTAFDQYGALTENQTRALRASLEKVQARNAERAERNATNSGNVSVSKIVTLFETANKRLKKPVYRAAELVLSLAPAAGANAGAVYVKSPAGDYLGKIKGEKFIAASAATADTLPALQKIAQDPKGEAVRYGRLTGSCCCCGRQLTDPVSVEMGIGPICAENWGF